MIEHDSRALALPRRRSQLPSCVHIYTPSFFREPRKINLSQGPASERLSAVMGDLASIDDAFDAALNLEESHIDDGWEDGLR